MAAVIFWMCLVLMVIVSINQALLPSEKNGISPEGGEEILQRTKERELSLRLHLELCLEKEIADLEARQEAVARPAWEVQRKIQVHRVTQLHTCTVFSLVVLVLFMF